MPLVILSLIFTISCAPKRPKVTPREPVKAPSTENPSEDTSPLDKVTPIDPTTAPPSAIKPIQPPLRIESQPRRGIWLTTVDSTTLQSRQNIQRFLKEITDAGFNTIYPVVWNGGYTLFKSTTMASTFDAPIHPDFIGRSILQELIEEAHLVGVSVIPWFEWGLKVPFSKFGKDLAMGPIAKTKGWLLQNHQGQHRIAFDQYDIGILNPWHHGVRNFFKEMVREVLTLPVEGVMFDDHFSTPKDFAVYHEHVATWCAEKRCSTIATNQEAQTELYYVEGILTMAADLAKEVRRSGKKFVLAPGGHSPYTRKFHHVDWVEMTRWGILDEIIVQMYRDTPEFLAELFPNAPKPHQVRNLEQLHEARRKVAAFGIGILSGLGSSHTTNGHQIFDQVRKIIAQGWGVSIFFDGTLMRPAVGESQETRRCWIHGLFESFEPRC